MGAESVMRDVAAAFEIGDLRPLFDAIDPAVVWQSGATADSGLRFGGTYNGRSGVLEITSQLAAGYLFRRFRPREILSSGDLVWGLFNVEGAFLPLPSQHRDIVVPFHINCAIRWRMRNNKVIEHHSFFDTLSLLQQQANQTQLR